MVMTKNKIRKANRKNKENDKKVLRKLKKSTKLIKKRERDIQTDEEIFNFFIHYCFAM